MPHLERVALGPTFSRSASSNPLRRNKNGSAALPSSQRTEAEKPISNRVICLILRVPDPGSLVGRWQSHLRPVRFIVG